MEDWPFDDPPNVAVVTTKFVLEGTDWINYVTHDFDDESWQFHGDSSPTGEENARIVLLSEIIQIDPTIAELSNLPLGCRAWRETRDSSWQTINDSNWPQLIKEHYEKNWKIKPEIKHLSLGPIHQLPLDFCILEFAPPSDRDMWTYTTCGMAQPYDSHKIELFLFSPEQDEGLVELLTVIVDYHRNKSSLGLHHTMNFGRPWLKDSKCDYGFISLPYLDGDALELLNISEDTHIHFFWLIPVTKQEVEYKKAHGVDALEEVFEKSGFNYVDRLRDSVV